MKKVLSFVAGTALLMAMCGMSAFADERTYLDPSTPEKVTIAEAKGDQEVVFANGTPITIVERTDGEEGAPVSYTHLRPVADTIKRADLLDIRLLPGQLLRRDRSDVGHIGVFSFFGKRTACVVQDSGSR